MLRVLYHRYPGGVYQSPPDQRGPQKPADASAPTSEKTRTPASNSTTARARRGAHATPGLLPALGNTASPSASSSAAPVSILTTTSVADPELVLTDRWLKIFTILYQLVGIGILVGILRRLGLAFIVVRRQEKQQG